MVPIYRFKLPGILIAIALMLTLGQLAGPVSAGDDVWTTSSLAGFTVSTITIDHTNSDIVYIGTDQGVLMSQDGGQNWRGFPNLTGQIGSILVHAENPSILYVIASNRLLKSEDGGKTWPVLGSGVLNRPSWVGAHPLRPEVIYVQASDGLFRSPDGGNSWSGAGLPVVAQVQAVAFDPTNADVMYVALVRNQGLFRTGDGGQSWSLISGSLEGLGSAIYRMGVDSTGALFLQTGAGIYRSADGGQSWQLRSMEENIRYYRNNVQYLGFAVDRIQPNLLYHGRERGMHRSRDGGVTWEEFVDLLPGQPIIIAVDPQREERIYAITGHSFRSGPWHWQLHKSVDGGASWQDFQHDTIFHRVRAHPSESGVILGLFSGRANSLWRSQNGTQSWQLSNAGLGEVQVNNITFDPTNSNIVYAGTQAGLYRSIDGGNTWTLTGLPTNVQVFKVVIDPQTNTKLYVGGSTGLLRSNNNGESWSAAAAVSQNVTGMAINREAPETVYAVANGRLHRSQDSGENWSVLNHPSQQTASVALKPDDPRTIYTGGRDGVYVSRDGGAGWSRMAIQASSSSNLSPLLRTDPRRPDALYLAWGAEFFISPDTGVTWFPLSQGTPGLAINDLAVDAGDPLTLYATFQNGVGGVWRYTLISLPEPPTPTPTVTNTPLPGGAAEAETSGNFSAPTVMTRVDLNIRNGPGNHYNVVGFLLQGQSARIIGRNSSGGWWKIECPGSDASLECWISAASQFSTAFNAEGVPIAPIPSTSEGITATPTTTPISILAVTATARAVESADPEATAVALFGLERDTDADDVAPDREEFATVGVEETGSIWRIMGWVLLLGIIAGGGFFVWRYAQATAPAGSSTQVFCPQCGTSIPAQARFCIKCGHPMGQ
jgi:photosystem II stability/assembly factor-like uncharacterized protein